MFKAIKAYGSGDKPLQQDSEGRLLVSTDQSTPGPQPIVFNESTVLIHPAPAFFNELSAENQDLKGDFLWNDETWIRIRYMRNHGDSVEILGSAPAFAGNKNPGTYRSTDNGETWQRILQQGQGLSSGTLYSTGKSVINVVSAGGGAGSGRAVEIWYSDTLDSDDIANWTLVATASAGYFTPLYGSSVKDNVVLLSTYGNKNAANPPRFIYISRDYGKTFDEVEVRSIADMVDSAHFHLHDCEYDPYADRIWVSTGDNVNSSLCYTDDWGQTWTVVEMPDLGIKIQPTSITALPDRILFGSDENLNGIKAFIKNPRNPKEIFTQEDIKILFTPDASNADGTGTYIAHVANVLRSDVLSQLDVYPYCLLLALDRGDQDNKYVRLVASPDGKQFYTILTLPEDTQLVSVTGPVSNDPLRRVFFKYVDARGDTSASMQMQFNYPKWIVNK